MLTILPALINYAFVTSVTPGPNNMMLMASGANFGFRRTIPHMLGVSLGHMFMVSLVGLGLAGIFTTYPVAQTLLTVVSVVYLLFLAWKIANAAPPQEAATTSKPFTFLQAAAFQWVNPKAWYMGVTAQTVFAPPETGLVGVFTVALVFALVNLPSVSLWAGLGVQVRKLLSNRARLRAFNWTMAALLVLSMYPVVKDAF
ncbi:MAG: LysE family translocator [Pseudomonadota bacterium]